MSDWQTTEREVLAELASRYKAAGYDVALDPLLEGTTMHADLIARRGDETHLVEIRSAEGKAAEREAQLRKYAEFARDHGWRFSLVLVNRDSKSMVEVPPWEHVQALIDDARKIDSSSWMAPLAAVAAVEAAARRALALRGQRDLPRPAPLAYIQALASEGMITPQEEQALRRVVAARNNAAHGQVIVEHPNEQDIATALEVAALMIAEGPPQPEPA
jgi:hypothetical protein